jgi:hypothetical protein
LIIIQHGSEKLKEADSHNFGIKEKLKKRGIYEKLEAN